eukprot:Amastigsp_a176599_15.p2 type:complete len:159 gc:universal Amastigsp_a176599_15:1037-1513(+)
MPACSSTPSWLSSQHKAQAQSSHRSGAKTTRSASHGCSASSCFTSSHGSRPRRSALVSPRCLPVTASRSVSSNGRSPARGTTSFTRPRKSFSPPCSALHSQSQIPRCTTPSSLSQSFAPRFWRPSLPTPLPSFGSATWASSRAYPPPSRLLRRRRWRL